MRPPKTPPLAPRGPEEAPRGLQTARNMFHQCCREALERFRGRPPRGRRRSAHPRICSHEEVHQYLEV
eukprot:4267655-Pyramimonas_sp.AAC.1